eukprot:NODE_11885_length_271_cov_254.092593.p2 GENE.NODE_11885_length_271_cov_254.092593~~NODE_11885_length_271_cov_254.092593.p2  ORF type:complete len:59 (-),score=19.73 NODE_11885_length_271_cov_254.092593:77-253(-)
MGNEGMVLDWNRDNPDRQVHEGDHIVEVNGTTDPTEMMGIVTQENHVEMIIDHHDLDI